MSRFAAFTAFALLPFCADVYAAPKELSASEFMENFSSLLDSAAAVPEVTEIEVIELEDGDPQTYVFIRGAQAHPPAPANLGGDGRLTLTRRDTGDRVSAAYRGRDGAYDQAELAKLNRLMRCSLTGRETAVSIKLIEILDAIDDKFGKNGLTLLSGYRTPRLNGRVPGAARRSLHMLGWAADIMVPGRTPAETAAYARKLKKGGVGYYPDAAFTHLDAGRARYWVVRRAAKPRAAAPGK